MAWIYAAVFLGGAGAGLLAGRLLFRPSRLEGLSSVPVSHPVVSEAPVAQLTPTEKSVDQQPTDGADVKESILLAQLQQTELAYQMASELNQFQAGFLARTSHELRSPINSVISLHQLILADLCESPEEEREYVAEANGAAQRMLGALDELITVSKVQHGRIELQIQPVNLKLVLDDLQRLTHMPAKNKNLRLEIQSPETDVYVLTDPSRLRQVMVHLVDRAIADLDEGWIHVIPQVSPAEGFAHVVIADDRPEEVWAEAVDLLKPPAPSTEASSKEAVAATLPPLGNGALLDAANTRMPLPSGLTLFADRTLIEIMQGKLDLVPNPVGDRGYAIRCSIPLIELEEG